MARAPLARLAMFFCWPHHKPRNTRQRRLRCGLFVSPVGLNIHSSFPCDDVESMENSPGHCSLGSLRLLSTSFCKQTPTTTHQNQNRQLLAALPNPPVRATPDRQLPAHGHLRCGPAGPTKISVSGGEALGACSEAILGDSHGQLNNHPVDPH